MSLYSLKYLLFLAVVWLLQRPLRREWRPPLFLTASYLFYFLISPYFLPLLVTSSWINHVWAKWLRQNRSSVRLWTGILLNLLIWVGARQVFPWMEGVLDVQGNATLVAVGVSFYTFQAIGYLIDIYRGYEGRPNWMEFSLFMAFWPVVLSGPICRLPEMLPQFRSSSGPDPGAIGEGTRRIILGLFMKLVLADTLARGLAPDSGVDFGFDQASQWSSAEVWLLCVAYGFQIFFDFAGYSHIAIGSAYLIGIRLRENFNDPYCSLTITDFWSRWHMSLSAWIRDYLFFPLAAARRGLAWRSSAVILSMIVFGLWHGFQSNFLLWGAFHGILLAVQRVLQSWKRTSGLLGKSGNFAPALLSWFLTFHLVSFGWILFRSENWGQIRSMLEALTRLDFRLGLDLRFVLLVLAMVGFYAIKAAWRGFSAAGRSLWARAGWWISPPLHITMILLIVIWSDNSSPFVYVRF